MNTYPRKYTPYILAKYIPYILTAIALCALALIWSCKSPSTHTDPHSSSLNAVNDTHYVLRFVQHDDYTYHFQSCLVDVMGTAKHNSCVAAFRSLDDQSVSFSPQKVFFHQPDESERHNLKELHQAYKRHKLASRAPIYGAMGASTATAATILTGRALLPVLKKLRPHVSGMWSIVALWASSYIFFQATQTLSEEGQAFKSLNDKDQTSPFLQTYKDLPVLIDHWDTLMAEDPSTVQNVPSVKRVLHDLGLFLLNLRWVDDQSTIHKYCLPSKKSQNPQDHTTISICKRLHKDL
ncbi:MAG: hypothetical protein OXC44_01300 [Proteobacteria bacterium]|nr:hypothetical protein [Pseudomonadota bacterium]